MHFTSKQVVTMVCAVSAAVVLAPVGVMAATGQLVNIVDPGNAGRAARVSAAGALHVETRPGVVQNSFNRSITTGGAIQFQRMYEVTGPNRIAITDVSVGSTGSTYAEWEASVVAFVQSTGTGTCGPGAGWTIHRLRTFMVPPQDTRQLVFPGPPIVAPGVSGKRTCVGILMEELGTGAEVQVFMGMSGYSFS